MVLEATMICLDNSEWMRNGDYVPTRMEAQQDAANLLCGAKTQSNPENVVGIMTSAGKSAMVQVSLTQDLGKLLSSLVNIKTEGNVNFTSAVRVAELALKHRLNKNQRQRIVVFVGSPISEDAKQLTTLGAKLKKNGVAVDVINFGEVDMNTEKLEAFVAAVNSNDNSHILTIPPGPNILADILLSSPIVMEEGEGGAEAAAAAARRLEFGFDPDEDPELAQVLRESRELYEREQQQRTGGTDTAASTTTAAPAPTTATDIPMEELDEEAAMARAIAESLAEQPSTAKSEPAATTTTATTTTTTSAAAPQDVDMSELSEEEQLRLALQQSLGGGDAQPEVNQILQDDAFMSGLVTSLSGVDPNAKQKDEKDKDKDKDTK